MNHTTDEFFHAAGMDDKADEMRRQMEEQEQPPTVRELVEENCRLHDQVHNLTLYLDYVKLHYPAAIGVMMQEYDGMPGYVPLSARGGECSV